MTRAEAVALEALPWFSPCITGKYLLEYGNKVGSAEMNPAPFVGGGCLKIQATSLSRVSSAGLLEEDFQLRRSLYTSW